MFAGLVQRKTLSTIDLKQACQLESLISESSLLPVRTVVYSGIYTRLTYSAPGLFQKAMEQLLEV